MKPKSIFYRFLSVILVLTMLFNLVACSSKPETPNNNSSVNSEGNLVVDGVEITDVFESLVLEAVSVDDVQTIELNVDDLVVQCTVVEKIDMIEAEVVPLNDTFVYLAYQNFVQYYDEDIDFAKLLKDVAVGATCVIVCVTLSAVSGPIGTFFGAVITSEFTAATIAVGAAIDAAVSGYLAYQDGGDASYIIGHMLNGVADGFKWAGILAPISGAGAGIKALRAVNNLRKVPGFEELSDKALRAVFEEFKTIAKETAKEALNSSDDALRAIYRNLSSELSEEITEDIFIAAFRNSGDIIRIIEKFNPFNTARELSNVLREEFLKASGASDKVVSECIKKIKNKSIKKLSDISDSGLREYVSQNMAEFVRLFGPSLSKEFMDDSLIRILGDDAFETVKKVIATDPNSYGTLIARLGRESVDEFLENADVLMLMQARYGIKNTNKLIHLQGLYKNILQNSDVDSAEVAKVVNGLLDGTVKSIEDITRINSTLGRNAYKSSDLVCATLRSLGLDGKASDFMDDVAASRLEFLIDPDLFPGEAADRVIANNLSKGQLVAEFGQEAYDTLLANGDQIICALSVQGKPNVQLINDLIKDSLSYHGISDDVIKKILSGSSIAEWGLADEAVEEIGNVVASYYRTLNDTTYINFINEYAEIRCTTAKAYNQSINYTTRNGKYAGLIMPSNDPIIKAKYGDIYMNSAGYPVFDQYAVARLEMPDLTGVTEKDIANANKLHHGVTSGIPGYTWHHAEDGKTMLLIPTDLHEAYRHDGGAQLLRDGVFGER